METDKIKAALGEIEASIESLERREHELNDEIINIQGKLLQLKESRTSLRRLCGIPEPLPRMGLLLDEVGLSDAIRQILKTSKETLTPLEIRDRLVANGYSSTHTNFMASIHTQLKRMATALEVTATTKGEKAAYRWARLERAGASLAAALKSYKQ